MVGSTSKTNDPFTNAKRQTYEGFMRFATVGTVLVVGLMIVLGVTLL